MSLEINGKLKQVLPMQSGQGKNGPWQKQEFVIETQSQYPKLICFTLWGDKANMVANATPGEDIKVFFDVESREYNGRWYTDAKAWKVETGNQGGMGPNDIPPPSDTDLPPTFDDDDLPF